MESKCFLKFSNIVLLLFLLIGCSKMDRGLGPVNPIQPSSSLGIWECNFDGTHYSGTIDTSFSSIAATKDTMISCTGTSYDKKANIYFTILINRKAFPGSEINTITGNALIFFDTSSIDRYQASYNSSTTITFKVDSLGHNRILGSFSGHVKDETVLSSGFKSITNGKFSFELNKGDNEPKFFSFLSGTSRNAGYFGHGEMITNSIQLDGLPYLYMGGQRFKLVIRTGGTIKPGTYLSSKGEVGLFFYIPSRFITYVNNDAGNVSVTINSVTGNIVSGTFSGLNSDGTIISNAAFSCRIKNYTPQADSTNKWQFSFGGDFNYNCYGGNMLKVLKSESNGKYFLKLYGESDFGTSKFLIALSSLVPITAGTYNSGYYIQGNKPLFLDELSFQSNFTTFTGNPIYLIGNQYTETYCTIDSIDSKGVEGTFFGNFRLSLSSGSFGTNEIKSGKFKASF